ncbi:hypothetical protein [Sediminicola luteus]|uniref:Uncharacterized protein n=1 Tax=Sediminicola luteus TaxID=319238 RepID=A0A2A4G9C9_9FLAO|nr:hypothetical protein [Sediminicola luteus]PCE64372.1 hypothetical protein B7P33_08745 [Sediminicola luteus]
MMLVHTKEKQINTQTKIATRPTLLLPFNDQCFTFLECALASGINDYHLITPQLGCHEMLYAKIAQLKKNYREANLSIQDVSGLDAMAVTQAILVLTEPPNVHIPLMQLALKQKATILLALSSKESVLAMLFDPKLLETQLFLDNPDNWTQKAILKYIMGHHIFWGKSIGWSGQVGLKEEDIPSRWTKAALAVQLVLRYAPDTPLKHFPEHYALQMPEI